LRACLPATLVTHRSARRPHTPSASFLLPPQTQTGCINSLAFDRLGTRLYAADSAGVLQEFSCDVSKGVEAAPAAPGASNLNVSMMPVGEEAGCAHWVPTVPLVWE
jgi:hypothetical protein